VLAAMKSWPVAEPAPRLAPACAIRPRRGRWDATVSMQRDLAAGRPPELLDQTGAVPLHQALSAALLPLERSARGEAPQFERT
jgi:hypothetical protein